MNCPTPKHFSRLRAPTALNLGDTVTVIRPASRLDEAHFKSTVKSLRNFGFAVALYPQRKSKDSFFAGSDIDRARELDWAMREPAIRAVFAARGGYGSARALYHLSSKAHLRWHPKLVFGYSDITYLHQWIQNQCGWMTYHSPLLGTLNGNQMKNFLRSVLNLDSETQNWAEVKNIGSKKPANGRLLGGNLSRLRTEGPAALANVPMILAIEDVNENFYRLDGMLGTLLESRIQKNIRGIIVGSLHGCGEADKKSFGESRIHEMLKALTTGPIWINAKFGHGLKDQRILPLGAKVEMRQKSLRFLEKIVG